MKSVKNCGLDIEKTVSSDAQFPRSDHFKKKICHHEKGPPLFSTLERRYSQTHSFRDMTILRTNYAIMKRARRCFLEQVNYVEDRNLAPFLSQ